MVFIKFFKIILILTKIKLKIELPKNCDILCYDEGRRFNLNIKKLFKSFKIDVIYVRLEEINLLILLKSLISKILNTKVSFKNHYIKNYCYQVDPKIILSTSHYDESFLYLKEFVSKKTKTILVQRCPYKNTDFNFRKKKETD
jgi:surface carbohydrate biosynthesis protein